MTDKVKYNNWIHAGFFSGLQKLSVPLSSLFVTMILAHKVLNKQEMGVWAIFMSITAVIELIRQGLVKTAMIKFINHSVAEHHRFVLGAAFFLNATITVFTALVMYILTPYFSHILNAPQLEQMLYLLQVGMLLMIPFSHFEWLMYSKVLFKGLFWTYFFRQGLTLGLVCILFVLNKKISLNTLVVIYNLGLFVGALVSYRYVKTFLINSFVFSKIWIVNLFHFGKYVFASGLSTLVFRSADQMMLSPILGSTNFNASQNIAMRFINLSDLPSQTLGDILFPKSAQSDNSRNPQKIKYYYEKTVGASLCVVLPLVLFVLIFPKIIIYALAGPQYYDAIPYLRLISLTSLSLAFLKQYGVIMDSTGRPLINFITISIIAIVHVLLLYYFLTTFHFLGAGYALLLSHLIGFIITQSLLYKLFKINFLNAFKYAFKFYPEFFKIILEKLKWKRH
jgi:O-antigen/teichoic acid export membrane protein